MSVADRRVAVVVFCEAPDGDSTLATIAIRKALGDRSKPYDGTFVEQNVTIYKDGQVDKVYPVLPVAVMDVGDAAGNGYLWTQPTPKAYRERGR